MAAGSVNEVLVPAEKRPLAIVVQFVSVKDCFLWTE